MLEYLSDEWVAAMNDAVAADERLQRATADVSLVVQHVVTHVPREDGSADDLDTTSYYVWLDHGVGSVLTGTKPDADVTFTCDYPTAVAITRGDERAQSAFMAGRLTLGGDVRALLERRALVAELEDVTRSVRDDTTFPD